jgi:hypothetical protein
VDIAEAIEAIADGTAPGVVSATTTPVAAPVRIVSFIHILGIYGACDNLCYVAMVYLYVQVAATEQKAAPAKTA